MWSALAASPWKGSLWRDCLPPLAQPPLEPLLAPPAWPLQGLPLLALPVKACGWGSGALLAPAVWLARLPMLRQQQLLLLYQPLQQDRHLVRGRRRRHVPYAGSLDL